MVDGHDSDGLADFFERQVRPYVFDGHQPSTSPRLVLVGGQPGSGKSHAIARTLGGDPDADLVYLTGDALRPFHPQYAALIRTDLLSMPNSTGPAVAAWVRSCIDHALAERFSLVLEGTFRDADVVAATVRRFAAAGYQTEAVVLAVRPERSRLDCLLRYLGTSPRDAARWTPPTAHDTSFARLPHTVAAIHDVDELHRITVQTRMDTVFTNKRQPGGRWRQPGRASEALLAEHERPLEPDAARVWLEQYRRTVEASERLRAIDARALPMYRALLEDAERIALMVGSDPADRCLRQHAEVRRHAVALLLRHDPSLAITTQHDRVRGKAFSPLTGIAPSTNDGRNPAHPPGHDGTARPRHR